MGPVYGAKEYAPAMTIPFDMSTLLDFSDKDAGGTCPSPISVSAMGAAFELSFGPLCDFAPIVRFFLLACASIVALRILFQG